MQQSRPAAAAAAIGCQKFTVDNKLSDSFFP